MERIAVTLGLSAMFRPGRVAVGALVVVSYLGTVAVGAYDWATGRATSTEALLLVYTAAVDRLGVLLIAAVDAFARRGRQNYVAEDDESPPEAGLAGREASSRSRSLG